MFDFFNSDLLSMFKNKNSKAEVWNTPPRKKTINKNAITIHGDI